MRSLSDLPAVLLPGFGCVVLSLLFAAPLSVGHVSLTPNVAWIICLVVATALPTAWPRWFAFAMGLLQDVLFGTPLGAQALLALLLTQTVNHQARRWALARFSLRWLEAGGMLLLWHGLLWGLCYFVLPTAPSFSRMLGAGFVSALWYPVFYIIFARRLSVLPVLK